MQSQSRSHTEHHHLASYADVHRAFKHINEVKVLAILALRPTTNEVDEAARKLSHPRRRTRNISDVDVVAAIIEILADGHAE
jgi:hypothetical protein